MCHYSPETKRKAKELRIIDDALFRLIAEQKDVCQEILQTLLEDNSIKVVSVTSQATISSLERGIILDALCKFSDGSYCNIEMQKTTNENDMKRVRFHASALTTSKTSKNTKFDNIPNVKILYITEYDALHNNQTITHISRCQLKANQYVPIDDGEDIIFANTQIVDGSKQSDLLQLFLRTDSFYNCDYPNLSRAIHHFKETTKGVNRMCESIEAYANERATERAIDATIRSCIHFKQTKAETTKYVKSEYSDVSDSYILERITLLWNQYDD